MKIGRVTVTGGFVLLWGILVYLDAGRIPAQCLMTALLHEAGHLIAVWLCRGHVASVELNAAGAVICLSQEHAMSYGKELVCVLAGPLVSLACALIFCLLGDTISGAYAASGLCLLQGVFNLLPAAGLDGGRALNLWLNGREYAHTDTVLRVTTLCSAWVTALLCAAAFVKGGYNIAMPAAYAFALTAMLGPVKMGDRHAKRYRGAPRARPKTGAIRWR